MSLIGSYDLIIQEAGGYPNAEVEVRFGRFEKNKFNSSLVSEKYYDRVYDYIAKRTEGTPIAVQYNDQKWGAFRLRQVVGAGGDNGTFIEKIKLKHLEQYQYNTRTSIALENEVNDPQVILTVQAKPQTLMRSVYRYTFDLNPYSRIELSKVMEVNLVKNTKITKFELELELIGLPTMESLREFNRGAEDLFKIAYGTDELYTLDELHHLNRQVNNILSRGDKTLNPNTIKRKFFNDGRNLRDSDLVIGGIVGNRNMEYTVTDKADGLRKILTFDRAGLWILFPPHEYNLVMRNPKMGALSNFIMEGEYLPDRARLKHSDGEMIDKRFQKKHVIFIYDILSSLDHGIGVQKLPHVERMRQVLTHGVLDRLNNYPNIHVGHKQFRGFYTNDFFSTMSDTFVQLEMLPYKTDGLMFIPEQAPYNPWEGKKKPLSRDRNLTKYPDICKWKPAEELTIDLKVKSSEDGGINVYSIRDEGEVEFKGTNINPLIRGVDPNDPVLNDNGRIRDGAIVEFGYNPHWENSTEFNGYSPYQLEARKVRFDKTSPNSFDVVEDTWDLAHNPLTIKTLTGQGTKLVRKYHNNVKANLWKSIPKDSVVLDIGIGAGGDITKQGHLSKVYGVDPSEQNLAKFRKRLDKFKSAGMTLPEYKVVQGYGEDMQTIKDLIPYEGAVDYVVFMLSFTFFWRDSKTLSELAKVIQYALKHDGSVIFLTMDGDTTQQAFNPVLGGVPLETIVSDDMTLKRVDERTILIDIPDSIVRDQTEYLVHLDDLALLLGGVVERERLVYTGQGVPLLNKTEKVFTTLFTHGSITQIGTRPIINPPLDEKIPPMEIPPPQPNPQGVCNIAEGTCNQGDALCNIVLNAPQMAETPQNKRKALREPGRERGMTQSASRVVITWNNRSFFRFSTVGDGTCFFHAVLGALSSDYRNLDYASKQGVGYAVRRDIAVYVTEKDPTYGFSNWSVFDKAKWPIAFLIDILALQNAVYERILNPNTPLQPRNEFGEETDPRQPHIANYDNSEAGIVALYNSSLAVGSEVYALTARLFDVDIYVGSVRLLDFVPIDSTSKLGSPKPSIIVGHCSGHYETMGELLADGSIRFIFPPDDPILEAWSKIEDVRPDDVPNAIESFLAMGAENVVETARLYEQFRLQNKFPELDEGMFSVFKYLRPSFSPSFEVMFTHLMTSMGFVPTHWSAQPQGVVPRPIGLKSAVDIRKLKGEDVTVPAFNFNIPQIPIPGIPIMPYNPGTIPGYNPPQQPINIGGVNVSATGAVRSDELEKLLTALNLGEDINLGQGEDIGELENPDTASPLVDEDEDLFKIE